MKDKQLNKILGVSLFMFAWWRWDLTAADGREVNLLTALIVIFIWYLTQWYIPYKVFKGEDLL